MMDSAVQRAVREATGESSEMMIGMYHKYWQPFGLLLTDMEKEGMSVNRSASSSTSLVNRLWNLDIMYLLSSSYMYNIIQLAVSCILHIYCMLLHVIIHIDVIVR